MKVFKFNQLEINEEPEYDVPDISYVGNSKDFFEDYELQPKIDILRKKQDLIMFLSDKESNEKLNDVKRKFLVRKLNLMFLYIDYYEYFEKRYGKTVYRFIGKEMDVDMEEEKTTIRASKMTSLIDDYGYDGGFVDFWSFGDSIVFKTINKIKII